MIETIRTFTALSEEFVELFMKHHPVAATEAGIHDYDHLLPDDSPAGLAARAAWLRDLEQRLTAAVPWEASRRHGTVFSKAMRPATTAIQTMLKMPNANSAAIRAQQQPTHQAPLLAPIRRAPDGPSRQEPSRKPSGLRHFPRHTSFNGVSS